MGTQCKICKIPLKSKRAKVCVNKKCKSKWKMLKNKNLPPITKSCNYCGKDFETISRRNNFCNPKCKYAGAAKTLKSTTGVENPSQLPKTPKRILEIRETRLSKKSKCSIEGCIKYSRSYGKCQDHYGKDWRQTESGMISARLSNQRRRSLKKEDVKINNQTLKEIFEKQTICFKCGTSDRLVLDHNIPLSKGGKLTYDNVVVLCNTCNSRKNAKDPKDFYTKEELERLNKLLRLNPLDCRYSLQQQQNEFNTITTTSGSYERAPQNNRITLSHNIHFREQENVLWQIPEIRQNLIDNRRKYLKKPYYELTDIELLRGFKVSGIHKGFSQHSPYWIKAFIEEFDIKSIYDPCGGWGHRLLGAHNINYIYNDIDIRSFKGVKSIINQFNMKEKIVYSKDATLFKPSENYEAVFTCPPYHNTENYSSEGSLKYTNLDIKQWINSFWRSLIKTSLKPSVNYFCFIISTKYSELMISECKSHNLELIRKQSIGGSFKSHFNKSPKNSRNISNNEEFTLLEHLLQIE